MLTPCLARSIIFQICTYVYIFYSIFTFDSQIDIGTRQWPMGAIVRYKPLGVLAMIDDGETDWKVIGIAEEDPMAPLMEDIDDVIDVAGGASESFREWMRLYKSPDQINQFALREEYQNRAFAEEVIEETHQQWAAYKAKLEEAQAAVDEE